LAGRLALSLRLLTRLASRCHRRAYVSPMLLSFLNVASTFDNEWTDRNADCCVNIVDEKNYYGYKYDELWSSYA